MIFVSDVEPDRTVERHLLVDKEVGEFVVENVTIFLAGEVTGFQSPGVDCSCNTLD